MKSPLTKKSHWPLYLLAPALFLSFAPLYFPTMQQLKLTRFVAVPNPLFWLGITYLAGYALSFLIPNVFLNLLEETMRFVRRFFWFFAIVIVIKAILFFYWINQHVIHSFLNSADEFSCYFMAECLRLKRWWVELHLNWEFFKTVHVGNRDGKWFSVYPPGWPLVYALGLKFKIQDWLNPILVGLALINFHWIGKRLYGFTAACLAILILLLSPFFTFTAATYFSHGTCLFVLSLFCVAYLKWFDAK
jgi:hypothetical protein